MCLDVLQQTLNKDQMIYSRVNLVHEFNMHNLIGYNVVSLDFMPKLFRPIALLNKYTNLSFVFTKRWNLSLYFIAI